MHAGLRLLAPGLVLVLLGLASPSAFAEPPVARPVGELVGNVPPVPKPSAEPPTVDPTSPNPPPSAYDRARGIDTTLPEPPESMVGQLFKTLFALVAVVGLIYLLFRFGPAKMLLQAQTGRGGKFVRVMERVSVDQRSALLVIDVGSERLLLGTGEGGMRVLARMDPAGSLVDVPLSQPLRPFRSFIDIVRPKPSNEDDNAPK